MRRRCRFSRRLVNNPFIFLCHLLIHSCCFFSFGTFLCLISLSDRIISKERLPNPRMANQAYGGYPQPGSEQGYPFQPGYGQAPPGFPPQPPPPAAFARPTFPKGLSSTSVSFIRASTALFSKMTIIEMFRQVCSIAFTFWSFAEFVRRWNSKVTSLLSLDDAEVGAAGEWGNFGGLDSKEIRRVFVRKVLFLRWLCHGFRSLSSLRSIRFWWFNSWLRLASSLFFTLRRSLSRLEGGILIHVYLSGRPFESMWRNQRVSGRTGLLTRFSWLLIWRWLVAKVLADDFRWIWSYWALWLVLFILRFHDDSHSNVLDIVDELHGNIWRVRTEQSIVISFRWAWSRPSTRLNRFFSLSASLPSSVWASPSSPFKRNMILPPVSASCSSSHWHCSDLALFAWSVDPMYVPFDQLWPECLFSLRLDHVQSLRWSWSSGILNCKWHAKVRSWLAIFRLVLGGRYPIDCWWKTTWDQRRGSHLCFGYALSRCRLYLHVYSIVVGK